MKKPKMSDLEVDRLGTLKMRSVMARSKKIKITINIDDDIIGALKRISKKTGVPYQSLMNSLLRIAVSEKEAEVSRLDRLESEVARLKKKLSA
jgi:predicted DNA binding CopG/RHH family protein